jgi:hypothetical protein
MHECELHKYIENFNSIDTYVARWYYKIDYYDVSLKILVVYTDYNPDSIVDAKSESLQPFPHLNLSLVTLSTSVISIHWLII